MIIIQGIISIKPISVLRKPIGSNKQTYLAGCLILEIDITLRIFICEIIAKNSTEYRFTIIEYYRNIRQDGRPVLLLII